MGTYSASNYQREFYVEGNFYNIKDGVNGHSVRCRNVANIKRKNNLESELNATFIMMNPGSCELIDESNKDSIPDYTCYDILEKGIQSKFRCSKADPVQFCIMEIMDKMNWNFVNILNLSDIKNPNSGKFFDEEKKFRKDFYMLPDIHSIFSKHRKDINSFIDTQKPVILAWGVDSHKDLKDIISKATDYIKEKGIEFVGIKNKDGCYYHIRPKVGKPKIEEIVNELNKLGVTSY
ncbi:TPA: hypothetical protein ACG3KV_003774 [Clostridioides difficile]